MGTATRLRRRGRRCETVLCITLGVSEGAATAVGRPARWPADILWVSTARREGAHARWNIGVTYHWGVPDVQQDFPGHELVSEGLADLAAGRESESALLVAMAAPRLRALGFEVPVGGGERPSHRLYEMLSDSGQGAHSRYNALIARMVSFARAAEHASSR